jgi:hypothetical protein
MYNKFRLSVKINECLILILRNLITIFSINNNLVKGRTYENRFDEFVLC